MLLPVLDANEPAANGPGGAPQGVLYGRLAPVALLLLRHQTAVRRCDAPHDKRRVIAGARFSCDFRLCFSLLVCRLCAQRPMPSALRCSKAATRCGGGSALRTSRRLSGCVGTRLPDVLWQ